MRIPRKLLPTPRAFGPLFAPFFEVLPTLAQSRFLQEGQIMFAHRILVPIDFSPYSDAALTLATSLARDGELMAF